MTTPTHVHESAPTPRIGSFEDGTIGFDCNSVVTSLIARRFREEGYEFVMRYIRRAGVNKYDLSTEEIATIRKAGLALGVVQHFAGDGWLPSATLGALYGNTAALDAKRLGLPPGMTVWCDLEGVSPTATTLEVIAHCNYWYDRVAAAGYEPGLYVGWRCGLTPDLLYRRLKFARYWAAYNLNRDEYPAVRGVQMRQWEVVPSQKISGVSIEWDGDTIKADARGGTPTFLLPV